MLRSKSLAAAVAACLLVSAALPAHAASEQKTLEELRNTVINLLQALVEQKVISPEQAAKLVQLAQEKAAKDASTADARDAGAVRVPYVPQIVKDEIGRQVAEDLKPKVVEEVVAAAKTEGWGVPGALPDWLARVRATGDIRVRYQQDMFGTDNRPFTVPDFNSINAAGGIAKAGLNAFLDSTEDRHRLRIRARLGLEAVLPNHFQAGIRLSTGSALDPGSESQTLGTGGARYTVGVDQAYVRYENKDEDGLAPATVTAGRMPSPWFTPSELVFARDLGFEGLAATLRTSFGKHGDAQASRGFLTLGAFPVQEVALNSKDSKWLVGAQLGTDLHLGYNDRLRVGAAFYDFIHLSGKLNPAGLSIYNYSAPPFIRYGNSYFDIQNSLDGSTNLFALAAKFQLANLSIVYDHQVGRYQFEVLADAVRNVGYKASDVLARSGIQQATRNNGYVAEVSFGDNDASSERGRWRIAGGYRYVQRDAVLDAWTDNDFHGGGTNARGYYLVGDLGLARGVSLRLRYLNADVLDAPPPYALDILQLDLNTRF
ncbi:MAG: putative porin [Pseudomonadota bacterium]